jgi:threonine/homoserine/homoserine lactone efflux protein
MPGRGVPGRERGDLLGYVLTGIGLAFAAGIQPGPLQAFILSKVVERGWLRTLPASAAPLISDIPIAILMLFILRHLPPEMARVLQIAGGLLLLSFAALAFRQWARNAATGPGRSTGGTLLQAVAVNLLNPGPYIGWSLILGPVVIKAWNEAPARALALVIAFYCTMVATLALTIVLFGATRFLGPRGRRTLFLLSALALAALGVYRLAAGLL